MNFIPFEKMSKKKQKEEVKRRRNIWTRSPITKIKNSKKIYNRKRKNYED